MDIDQSGPRLYHLFLRSLLIEPAPPYPHAVQFPAFPAVIFRLPLPPPQQSHPPTWDSPVSIPAYQKPITHPSLTEADSSSHPSPQPRLSHPRRRFSPAAAKIFYNVASSCCSAAVYRHHGLRNFPPPSYPISFA